MGLLNDNLLIPKAKTINFYSVQNIQESLQVNNPSTPKSGVYLSLYFRKDFTYTLF